MEVNEYSIRHTGEHLLIGSLVKRVDGSRVVRVVHEPDVDKAFIESESRISWDDVVEAAKEANKKVREGYPVSIEYFDSLDEAKRKYPGLRAYEERLENKDRIRVVNIGGFDYSACKNPHVENTSEVGLIIPIRLSSVRKGLYEVVFISGSKAYEQALTDSTLINRISRILGCSREDILRRVSNMVDMLNIFEEFRRVYSKSILYGSEVLEGKTRYLYIYDKYIDLKYVMGIASQVMIDRDINVLAIVSWDGEKYTVFVASRNFDIEQFKSRVKTVAGGSGGGKPGMYMGYIENPEAFKKLFDEYLK
ncbi:MAG TPA: hypothetical protein EYH44_03815 [Thermoprotei archaeon]|nr:hypothetical protein [Thermoprotei archaeon]